MLSNREMNASKMNGFLQRMLRKSDEELNSDQSASEELRNKQGSPKASWIKRLGSSPSKYKLPSPMGSLRTLNNGLETFEGPSREPPMPDLETIIREFEMGFLSPTKQEDPKQRNFVKKIVAAFEVRYKAYNDLKSDQEREERRDNLDSPKRRSGIFNTFKAEEMKNLEKSPKSRKSDVSLTPSKSHEEQKTRRLFGSPFKKEAKFDCPDSGTNVESSGKFAAPMKSEDSSSDIFSASLNFAKSVSKDPHRRSGVYVNPLEVEQQDSNGPSFLRFESEESKLAVSTSGLFNPLKSSSLDETTAIDSIDMDVTLPEPEETIILDSYSMIKTSTAIDLLDHRPETPDFLDKTPQIVGAFLKKPIEVEDTSIDWIPITGKKLPRKRSLKKILSALTSKKSFEKKCSLFSSQRNLTDESRELQDSGYDEKSCSSSSLTSLVSISEALLQQENSYVEPERRSNLSTFRSSSLEDEAFYETCNPSKRKLVLTEVPREDLKVDLGPSFPLTMSLDRRTPKRKIPGFAPLSRVPKHPFLSEIPKHPFVSTTKMDENLTGETVKIRNDLYEVEFRRSCDFSFSSRSSSSLGSNYDVPRRFLSRSESEICEKLKREPVYDVPRRRYGDRPKSSVYEDALSLKRRSHQPTVPDFYAADDEPHYATVKPRNRRVYLSRDMMKSTMDLSSSNIAF